MATVGGHHKLAFGFCTNSMLLHELAHPVFAHTDAPCHQLFVHAWPAVFALDLGVNGTDVSQQGFVTVTCRPTAATSLLLRRCQWKYSLALTWSTSQQTLTGYTFLIW